MHEVIGHNELIVPHHSYVDSWFCLHPQVYFLVLFYYNIMRFSFGTFSLYKGRRQNSHIQTTYKPQKAIRKITYFRLSQSSCRSSLTDLGHISSVTYVCHPLWLSVVTEREF